MDRMLLSPRVAIVKLELRLVCHSRRTFCGPHSFEDHSCHARREKTASELVTKNETCPDLAALIRARLLLSGKRRDSIPNFLRTASVAAIGSLYPDVPIS